MKTSNMKKVLQMTMKHDPNSPFDAESRIAGMSSLPGFISAVAVASKTDSDVVDQIITLHEISPHDNGKLMRGQRYAWVMNS